MPANPKTGPVGRPKLAKKEAKGKIVPVRFSPEDLNKITAAAKSKQQTVSQWFRETIHAAL
jgi:predicted HicB family RNase H-like nuclease